MFSKRTFVPKLDFYGRIYTLFSAFIPFEAILQHKIVARLRPNGNYCKLEMALSTGG